MTTGMVTDPFERVGVVGTGQMGAGIVEVCARAGLSVVAHEPAQDALDGGRARVETSLHRAVVKGKLVEGDARDALARIVWSSDPGALADRDLVVEAIVEDEVAKTELFARLDRIVERGDAVLASNTSSIPIMTLGMATARPEQVIGVHFFNPVPVLPLVELVPSLRTSPDTQERARTFAQDALGKTTIVATDRAGFVVNGLLIPFLLCAVRMVESGFATPADVDRGMELGCAHPMGPLRLADLIGLDTVAAIGEAMYAEYREPLYAPTPLLHRMVRAGRLGRKSGRGFYDYPSG